MDCSWLQALRGPQVGMRGLPEKFVMPAVLNRWAMWALIDTGCGQTLVQEAEGKCTRERLSLRCIHGDVRDYPTKLVHLELGNVQFTCRVGILSHLDALVLVGWDCPILCFLLENRMGKRTTLLSGQAYRGQTLGNSKQDLLLGPGELAHLMQSDPMLEHACNAAKGAMDHLCQGPQFSWERGLLYHHEGDQNQLVVPHGLRARLLYLAHELPLLEHQAVDKTLARLPQRFYWPGIPVHMAKHCATCLECQLTQP